jgi:hypothetical protein
MSYSLGHVLDITEYVGKLEYVYKLFYILQLNNFDS